MKITSSYDQDSFELTITVDGRKYVYVDVSPFHHSEFRKRAKYNKGRAMAYIRGFKTRE
jgi:hypothetical protein